MAAEPQRGVTTPSVIPHKIGWPEPTPPGLGPPYVRTHPGNPSPRVQPGNAPRRSFPDVVRASEPTSTRSLGALKRAIRSET